MKRHGIVPAIVFALALAGFPGLATALEVGDKAPDFELQSSQAGKFKLSDYAGKKNVLVQFYVLDYTPT
jgi:peroxiredoxin